MVIVIIGILAVTAINVPHLVSSTRKSSALQELLATMEAARGRALRNNGLVYLAFSGPKAGGSLEPLRQYAILDYDETAASSATRFKLVTPWQKLPEGYVFVNSNVSTGTVSTNLLSFQNAAQDVPGDGQNTSTVPAQCLAFGSLGQVIFPEGAIGTLQIPIAEGIVQSDIIVTRKGSQPTASDCYYIEVRRNTGRAFLLP